MDAEARNRRSLASEQLEAIFSSICTHDFKGRRIRSLKHDGQVWVVFADVCKALDYKNPNHEKKKVRPHEMCRLEIGLKNTLATCINRAGVVSFALLSNKAEASDFLVWAGEHIFGEVSIERDEILRLICSLSKDQLTEVLLFIRELRNRHSEEVDK